MADVDTFPMTKNIFEPIEKTQEKSIWVLKYDTSVKHNVTFSMHFMAMRSQTWKQIFQNSQSTTELLDNFNEKLKLNQQLDKSNISFQKRPETKNSPRTHGYNLRGKLLYHQSK